jgi:hypothetical protein
MLGVRTQNAEADLYFARRRGNQRRPHYRASRMVSLGQPKAMVAQSFGSFRKLERLAHGGYAIGSNAEIFKTASRQRHAQSPPANNLQTVKGLGILAENLVGNRRCHARRLSQSFEDIDFSDARKQVPHAAPLSLTAPVDYALVDEIQNTVR